MLTERDRAALLSMMTRKISERDYLKWMTDKPSKGVRAECGEKTELDHFMVCPVCTRFFDMRRLNDVLEHVHDGEVEFVETFGPPTRRM